MFGYAPPTNLIPRKFFSSVTSRFAQYFKLESFLGFKMLLACDGLSQVISRVESSVMRVCRSWVIVCFVALLGICIGLHSTAAVRPGQEAREPPDTPEADFARDLPNAADHPLTGRFQGSAIYSQTHKAYDELVLPAGPMVQDKMEHALTVQGRVTRTLYIAPLDHSTLEILANHRDALLKRGFQIVFECASDECGHGFTDFKYGWNNPKTQVRATNLPESRSGMISAMFESSTDCRYVLMRHPEGDGRETVVSVFAAESEIHGRSAYMGALNDHVVALVEVVEPKPMQQSIVTIGALEIATRLQTDGRVAFYGIFFDFDKAELKPESDLQLLEMASFLRSQPQTRAFVIGHTDNQGGLDYNLSLSQRRAEAVMRALTQRQGISAQRLTARGLGQLAPVASNHEEEGRARNRRVELVEQQ